MRRRRKIGISLDHRHRHLQRHDLMVLLLVQLLLLHSRDRVGIRLGNRPSHTLQARLRRRHQLRHRIVPHDFVVTLRRQIAPVILVVFTLRKGLGALVHVTQ